MAQDTKQRIAVGPGEGRLAMFGLIGARHKIDGEETGGTIAIVEQPVEPGAIAPPHVHTREDEYTYVLEGTLGVRVGDEEIHATPGTWIVKPRNVPHVFWNAGPERVRFIEIIVPAGLERLFDELSELVASGRADPRTMAELAERYGCPLTNMEWVPELVQRYGLKGL